jgi:hypothetical protein
MLTMRSRPDLASSGSLSTIEGNALTKRKTKQMIEDINRSYNMTTESRSASAHLKWSPADLTVNPGQTTQLPDFRRRAPLSNSFVPGI